MSETERDDEPDQPGGTVVPFPGARAVPVSEVAPGAELDPVPDALEGEIVTEEEYARLTGLQRRTTGRVVRLAAVVRESERTTGAGRAALRAGLTVGQGVGSWARRGHDAATLGVYRRQIAAAEAAGDTERLADWTTRTEQARERRHGRLMDAPKLAAGLALVTAGGLVTLVAGVLLVGLLVQVSGAGRFLGVSPARTSTARTSPARTSPAPTERHYAANDRDQGAANGWSQLWSPNSETAPRKLSPGGRFTW